MYGEEVALEARLTEALDIYERLTGRRPSFDSVNPHNPSVQSHYKAFSRAHHRIAVEASRGEWIALERGIKPMLRMVVGASEWPGMRASCESRGYLTEMVPFPVDESRLSGSTRASQGVSRVVAFIGRDGARLGEAAEVDAEMLVQAGSEPSWRVLGRRLGELLGYPRCCVDQFVKLAGDHENIDVIRASVKRSERFEPLLNNLSMSVVHAISWYPCRYDCAVSLRAAREVDRQLFEERRGQHGAVRRLWAMPRVYFDERRQLLFDGRVDAGVIRYRGVHTPFTFDRSASHAVLDWIFYAEVVRRLAGADAVRVVGGVMEVMRGNEVVEEVELGEDPVVLPFG